MTCKPIFHVAIFLACSSYLFAHQPPQHAIDACHGLSSGSSCQVNTPRGNLDGTCATPGNSGVLACVPEGHQRSSEGRSGRGQNDRAGRQHSTVQSDGISRVVEATQPPISTSEYEMRIEGADRIITTNGVPEHNTGRFPNSGNPHSIEEQDYEFRVPAYPTISNTTTPVEMNLFGVAVNGVPFDPAAAEWYQGDRGGDWQYEALSGAVPLGIDQGIAHVQPNGAYHYHGVPQLLLQGLSVSADNHSPLVGWAADGFPIYALYGYRDGLDARSEIIPMRSGYQLKQGNRPKYNGNPGGTYDGTFINDYEFRGTGNLDQCNGRQTVTPEFPGGTYAYFLTEDWPVIPRCFRGQPSSDFIKQRRR